MLARRLLAALLVTLCTTGAVTAAPDVRVTVDGEPVRFDQPPILINGRVLVPLRGVFERLGATVEWNSTTHTVRAIKAGTTVELRPGQHAAVVNGRTIELDVPPHIVNGRIVVPLRFVSQALGAAVHWDAAASTVAILTAASGGTVSVTVAARVFRVGQVITATVTNQLSQSIFSGDSKTDCSILIVERWTGQRWDPVLGCQLARPPGFVEIRAGTSLPVALNPMSAHLSAGVRGRTVLGAGSYRLKLTYGMHAGAESQAAYSEQFNIRD